jgi:tetratricopeptide (TPR) repeat protein
VAELPPLRSLRSKESLDEQSRELIVRLGRGLLARDLDDLKQALELASIALRSTAPIASCAEFVDYVARCMDLDWGLILIVEDRFSCLEAPRDPTLSDRVHLDIVEGLLHFHRSHYDNALQTFQNAATIAGRMPDDDLLSISLYYLARTTWRKAEYRQALQLAAQAKVHARNGNLPRRVALISIVEGWLRFLLGDFELADALVAEAEREMNQSHDHVTRGDIESYRGRRARQSGNFEEAVGCFTAAIQQYSQFDTNYRNVARCHRNIAYVQHLQLRRFREDETAATKREVYRLSSKLQLTALHHSEEAERIYNLYPSRTRRRRAKVLNDRALLFFDASNWSKAIALAEEAHALAEGDRNSLDVRANLHEGADSDNVTMANARIIACMAALELDEDLNALTFARQAAAFAETTENRRVRARALIWLGTVLLRFDNPIEASRLWSEAAAHLEPERRQGIVYDYLLMDLMQLRRAIDKHEGGHGDPTVIILKASEVRGSMLEATLERVEVDVIRHVYEAKNKNMDATARELGIGDERVRRAVGPARRKATQ